MDSKANKCLRQDVLACRVGSWLEMMFRWIGLGGMLGLFFSDFHVKDL
jgi:hypothetical protein